MSDHEGRDDAVRGGIGERGAETLERADEITRYPVVGHDGAKRRTQRFGAALRDQRDRGRQRIAGAHRSREQLDRFGPALLTDPARRSPPGSVVRDRGVGTGDESDQRHRGRPDQHDDGRCHPQAAAQAGRHELRGRDVAQATGGQPVREL